MSGAKYRSERLRNMEAIIHRTQRKLEDIVLHSGLWPPLINIVFEYALLWNPLSTFSTDKRFKPPKHYYRHAGVATHTRTCQKLLFEFLYRLRHHEFDLVVVLVGRLLRCDLSDMRVLPERNVVNSPPTGFTEQCLDFLQQQVDKFGGKGGLYVQPTSLLILYFATLDECIVRFLRTWSTRLGIMLWKSFYFTAHDNVGIVLREQFEPTHVHFAECDWVAAEKAGLLRSVSVETSNPTPNAFRTLHCRTGVITRTPFQHTSDAYGAYNAYNSAYCQVKTFQCRTRTFTNYTAKRGPLLESNHPKTIKKKKNRMPIKDSDKRTRRHIMSRCER